jgi:hypothetical protein
MSVEAMKQALEALDEITDDVDGTGLNTTMSFDKSLEAITSLRQAIEQAEKQEPVIGTKTWYEDGKVITQNLYPSDVYKQEKQDVEQSSTESKETFDQPVAWMCSDESLLHKGYSRFSRNCEGAWNIPVYTTPQPQREWVGLTNEEMREVYGKDLKYKDGDYARYARAIEAKLRSKNQ